MEGGKLCRGMGTMIEDINLVLTLCYKHVGIFGNTFLSEAFSTLFVSLHNSIIDALDSSQQKVAIAVPRGLRRA